MHSFRLSGKGTSKASLDRKRTLWKRRRISSLSGLFYRNPAVVTGVALAPLVVVCTSLQTAAALSLAFLVLSVPVQLAAGLGGRYLPKPLWLPAMLVLSAVLLYPAYYWVKGISPTIFDALGLYLPLMAVTPVLTRERFCLSVRRGALWSLVNALSGAAGFALVAFLAGGVREYLGRGSLLDNSLSQLKISGVMLPFFGFIMVGFLAAIAKGLVLLVRSVRSGGRLRTLASSAAGPGEETVVSPAEDQAVGLPAASVEQEASSGEPSPADPAAAVPPDGRPRPSAPAAVVAQEHAPSRRRRPRRKKVATEAALGVAAPAAAPGKETVKAPASKPSAEAGRSSAEATEPSAETASTDRPTVSAASGRGEESASVSNTAKPAADVAAPAAVPAAPSAAADIETPSVSSGSTDTSPATETDQIPLAGAASEAAPAKPAASRRRSSRKKAAPSASADPSGEPGPTQIPPAGQQAPSSASHSADNPLEPGADPPPASGSAWMPAPTSSPPAGDAQPESAAPAPRRRQRRRSEEAQTASVPEDRQQSSGAWSAPSYGPVPRQTGETAGAAGSSDAGDSGAEK